MTCSAMRKLTYLSDLPEITRKFPKYIYFRKDYLSENYRNLGNFLLWCSFQKQQSGVFYKKEMFL